MLPRLAPLKIAYKKYFYIPSLRDGGTTKFKTKIPWRLKGVENFYFDHLNPDSILRENLQLGSVIRNVSEELSLVAIPLHAVKSVTLHVKPEEDNKLIQD